MHSFSFACLFCIVIILVYMYAHYCTINVTVTLFKRNKEYLYFALQIYLDQNIFNIPRHVVLPEDAVQQTHPFSREERDSLDRDIDNLRNKILAVRFCIWNRIEMFYLTTHSIYFIYGYMASDIWLRTILIVRKETRCPHIGYSYRLKARVLLYAPSCRQDNTYHIPWSTGWNEK